VHIQKIPPFNHWKHKDLLSQCASRKFVLSVSQPEGHNANLGHEAILNRQQNNFITITTSHYFNKYIKRGFFFCFLVNVLTCSETVAMSALLSYTKLHKPSTTKVTCLSTKNYQISHTKLFSSWSYHTFGKIVSIAETPHKTKINSNSLDHED
jgi:hypothetical protein